MGDHAPAPTSRLEEADLERLTLNREAWQSERPGAPLGQEWGIAVAGIEMAGTLGQLWGAASAMVCQVNRGSENEAAQGGNG